MFGLSGELATAVVAGLSALSGTIVGLLGATRLERERLAHTTRLAMYERQLLSMQAMASSCQRWIDIMLTIIDMGPEAELEESVRTEQDALIDKANEISFELRANKMYVAVQVGDELAAWLLGEYELVESRTHGALYDAHKNRSAASRELGQVVTDYVSVLHEMLRRFQHELAEHAL